MSIFTTERPNSIWIYLFDEHRLAAGLGWQRLLRQPYQTFGAVLLMTLSLALLTVFGLALHQAQKWQSSTTLAPQIVIFPKAQISSAQIPELSKILASFPVILNCEQHNAKDLLSDLLSLDESDISSSKIAPIFTAEYPLTLSLKEVVNLKASLEKISLVHKVDFDMIEHAKITQALKVAKVTLTLLGVALISCVVVVINYSIKLFMDRYQQEIAILYHLGASSNFIQRPYLYQGFFLGIFGSIGALIVLSALQYFLSPQINMLLDLYGYSWSISLREYQVIAGSLLGVVLFSVGSALFSTRKWLSLFEHERLG